MSIISESLTIGLLLMLVFGALFFYIYSRLSYVEKRISLMENILLDIKITQQQMPTHILPQVPSNIRFQHVAFQPPTREVNELPELKFNEIQEKLVKVTKNSDEEIYASVLENAHSSSPVETTPESFVPSSEPFVPSSEPFEPASEIPTKVTVNYESMTKDELLEICKTKGLRVGNRPGREKLLQLIRKSEDINELQPAEENDI